jgi:glycosyltransferase involved in cell wall biosynthesis
MKNILFVVNSLTIGGSEKSLVSLLNCIDYNKYQVDLLMFKKGGDFEKYIPSEVNVLEIPDYYKFISGKKHKLKFKDRVKYSLCRLSTSINLRTNKKIQSEQIIYKHHKNVLKSIDKNYDVAVAYSQGFPTYFVADKVNAQKKLAWINCDYATTGYDKDWDELFYNKFDKIIAVSETIKKSILEIKPIYKDKIQVVLDIVNPKLIEYMSEEEVVFEDKSYINILTVARLVIHYKGYDIAVKAAKALKDNGYKFRWYVVGEGECRKEIESLIIENNLKDTFILLGKKQNPYPYMKNCDLYVQPSRKEGFGLTVAEAKILRRPIVCTNFNTANELICNYEDGLIVGMD